MSAGIPPDPRRESPCVGICRIGGDGRCLGCFRERSEIGGWMGASREAKREMWERALREWERRGMPRKEPPPWMDR